MKRLDWRWQWCFFSFILLFEICIKYMLLLVWGILIMGLQHEHCTTTKWNCFRFAIDTSSNPFIFWFHPPSIISNICWISSQYNSSLFLRGFNTLLIWFGYTGDLMLVRTCLSHHHLQISRNSLPARIVLLFNMFALYEIDLWFINSWFLSNIIFWLLIAQTHSPYYGLFFS